MLLANSLRLTVKMKDAWILIAYTIPMRNPSMDVSKKIPRTMGQGTPPAFTWALSEVP